MKPAPEATSYKLPAASTPSQTQSPWPSAPRPRPTRLSGHTDADCSNPPRSAASNNAPSRHPPGESAARYSLRVPAGPAACASAPAVAHTQTRETHWLAFAECIVPPSYNHAVSRYGCAIDDLPRQLRHHVGVKALLVQQRRTRRQRRTAHSLPVYALESHPLACSSKRLTIPGSTLDAQAISSIECY